MNNKPCLKCPWIQKGQPLITDELRECAKNGVWFCCHVNGGTCHGSVIKSKQIKKIENMNVQNKISEISRKFNLDVSRIDDASNKAIATMSDFLDGIDYEISKDGITILSDEDEIIELSEGNYNSRVDFENEVNIRYVNAFELEASSI